jgi:hypothetical protein
VTIENIYGLTFGVLVLVLITIVAVVVIWQGLATWRARMSIAREEAYQRLADKAVEAEARTSRWQDKAGQDLADIRDRVMRMETLLKQVE